MKTEFIDAVVTMQLLSLVKLYYRVAPPCIKWTPIAPGRFGALLEGHRDKCRPLMFNC